MDTRVQYQLVRSDGANWAVGEGEKLSLGRSRQNVVQIADSGVSRQHATLLVARGRCWIRDEDSTHGTFVNGQRVMGQQELRVGDELRIGPAVFHLEQVAVEARGAPLPQRQRRLVTWGAVSAVVIVAVIVIVLSAGGGGGPGTAEVMIPATVGGTVELNDGAQVIIPPSALDTDQQVALIRLDSKPDGNEASFSLPGQVYEVQTAQEVFDLPIQITLPYDEQLIPADRTEEEVFAVFLHEGQWHRVDGHVDTVANTITVEVLHASIWTWATDKLANGVDAIKSYLGILDDPVQVPRTVEEAEALVEQRYQEWKQAVEEANFTIEELDEAIKFGLVKEIAREITLHTSEALIMKLGGKEAVLTIKGETVAHWAGPLFGALYLFDVSEHSGEVLGAMYKVEKAYDRLREAQAMLKALQNPDAQTLPSDYVKALNRAVTEAESTAEDREQPTGRPEVGPDEVWVVGEFAAGRASCINGILLRNLSEFAAGSQVQVTSTPEKVFIIESVDAEYQIGSCLGQGVSGFNFNDRVEAYGLVATDPAEVAHLGDCPWHWGEMTSYADLIITICPSADYYYKSFEENLEVPKPEPPPPPEANLVPIPNVVGLTPDEAERELKAAGFGVLPGKDGYSNDVPMGHIYEQDPDAGELYNPKNTVVMIYRSRGPAPTDTPIPKPKPTDTPVPPTSTPAKQDPSSVGPSEVWLVGRYETTSEYCERGACVVGTVLKGISKFVAGSGVPVAGTPQKVFVIERVDEGCRVGGACAGQPLGVFYKDHEVEVRGLVVISNGNEVTKWREVLVADCNLGTAAQGSDLYMTICPSADYYSRAYK